MVIVYLENVLIKEIHIRTVEEIILLLDCLTIKIYKIHPPMKYSIHIVSDSFKFAKMLFQLREVGEPVRPS